MPAAATREKIPHPAKESLDLATIMRTVGDPLRLDIVRVLADGPRNCGELSEQLGIPASTGSYHLRLLREAGLIDVERHGPWAYYYVNVEALAALQARISAQLAAFQIPSVADTRP